MAENITEEHPAICVAFGIEFGEQAREEGLVYDVDYVLLRDAYLAGGMNEDDMLRYPTIVRRTDNPLTKGRRRRIDVISYARNESQPCIELYSFEGIGEVSTKTAAHEAKHLADHVHIGNSAFVSEQARVARKVMATLGSIVLVGAYNFVMFGENIGLNVSSLVGGALTIVEGDLMIASLLLFEYASRKHERRARRAEHRVKRKNLLQLGEGAEAQALPAPRSAMLRAILKQMFIPDFRR